MSLSEREQFIKAFEDAIADLVRRYPGDTVRIEQLAREFVALMNAQVAELERLRAAPEEEEMV